MKTKLLLPIIALGLFAACSDDSNSATAPAAPTSEPVADTTAVPGVDPAADPGQQTESTENMTDSTLADTTASTTDQTDTSASVPTDPVTDPVTDPTTPVENPNVTYVYYGAELTGKDQFKYGRFEARMKMVSIPGSVSSMFLYYDNSWEKGVEPWNEIDIEVLGKGGTMWQSNIITREADPSIKSTTASESKPLHDFGFDATEDFHLFAIVWTPEYVAWEIDSVEIRRDTLGMARGTHADADQVAFLTEQQSLRFNLWASKSAGWVGRFTGDELAAGPQVQWIDYVRVYSYDESTKGFTQLWQDDFDGTSLSEHWAKGNWEMERVELDPFNVVVEDGYCKLMMTREPG